MLRVYQAQLVGPAPRFPREIEAGIDQYLATQAVTTTSHADLAPRAVPPGEARTGYRRPRTLPFGRSLHTQTWPRVGHTATPHPTSLVVAHTICV